MSNRPPVPASLERSLFLETGYRCGICRDKPPLVIDHIEDWAKVQEHKFENMIVLCTVCHALKVADSSPRHINRASLLRRKQQLLLLNARYSDMERRFLEACQSILKDKPTANVFIYLHNTMFLQMKYLVDDGYAIANEVVGGVGSNVGGHVITNNQVKYTLTHEGREFVIGLSRIE